MYGGGPLIFIALEDELDALGIEAAQLPALPWLDRADFELVGPDGDLLLEPRPSPLAQRKGGQPAPGNGKAGNARHDEFGHGDQEGQAKDARQRQANPAARGAQRPVRPQGGRKQGTGRGAGLHWHDGLALKYWQRFGVERMPSPKKVKKLPRAAAEAIFERFHEIEPEPKGELDYVNAYTLLVAVVLSAQATDAGVNKATKRLFELAPSPAAMVALGIEGITEHIKTIGLYRGKAKNVFALSQLLLDKHGGEVPEDREALEALPGVGRKTANVVLNIWFKQPTIAVDTHLFRVGNRTGLAPGATPLAVELALIKQVPERFMLHAHHWLILHGRYICKARKPECWRCPIREWCLFEPKTPAPRGV